jgi:hypothetical protein
MSVSVRADDPALQRQLLAPLDVSAAQESRVWLGEFSCDAPAGPQKLHPMITRPLFEPVFVV